MNPIDKTQIDYHIVTFYSDVEERRYKLSEYRKQIFEYAQKIYTESNVNEWEIETIRQTLYNDNYLNEFETLFSTQNEGLIYFKGKSRLIEISPPLCRDLATLKSGKEIEYSLYSATFENGLQGKFLRNFTFSQQKPQIGEIHEFEYSVTNGKYNARKREFYTNKSIKIILPKKVKQLKTKTHDTLI